MKFWKKVCKLDFIFAEVLFIANGHRVIGRGLFVALCPRRFEISVVEP